ncbi:MAG TPA: hypothetical protein VH134_02510 [Candidatus Dormibacteraeota bacterium]|nr:hypothetical protein [Candidatus Dormibacteraeota bacterium]
MSTTLAPAWAVHLPTALETRVRSWTEHHARDPWPSARALSALVAEGATRDGPPRTAGAGRGLPILSAQRLRWCELDLEMEFHAGRDARVECNLIAPSWDELAAAPTTEDAWWELVDAFCAAVDARHGAVVDGEALDPDEPTPAGLAARLRRHLGLLVPEHLAAAAGSRADAYRILPRSGLTLLLR